MRARAAFFCLLAMAWVAAATPSLAQDYDVEPAVTLFKNVKVFNGSDDKLIDADVLVEGNLIKQVGKVYKNTL